jgi:phosphate transport system substrate-binding protein
MVNEPLSDRLRAPLAIAVGLLMLGSLFAGCITSDSDGGQANLKQTGSSTVLPLAQAWAQEFEGADIEVSGGGSSHGRNALLTENAELGDASSKIGPGDYEKVGCSVSESEIEAAQEGPHPWQYPECNGVTPTEWVVAWDVLTVVVHPSNNWANELTYEQLRQIFTTENTAEKWSEVEGLEGAPDEKIEIHAPDAASGTYEFFFEEVAGSTDKSLLSEGSQRYHGSANDNVILSKISQNENAIGFFGLAYYVENDQQIDSVAIAEESGSDAVEPTFETAKDYPITRPLHIYTDGIPSGDDATTQAVQGYMCFAFSEEGQSVVPDVGYVKESDFAPQEFENQQAQVC